MDSYTKEVFKTAFEIDQSYIIDQASDRQDYIDQGQSINLFIPGNSSVQYISDLHILAWKKGLKSLYYLRSTNPSKASVDNKVRQTIDINKLTVSECPSCE
jgi:ribonucleoside-diphosphate reductase alpha chain